MASPMLLTQIPVRLGSKGPYPKVGQKEIVLPVRISESAFFFSKIAGAGKHACLRT